MRYRLKRPSFYSLRPRFQLSIDKHAQIITSVIIIARMKTGLRSKALPKLRRRIKCIHAQDKTIFTMKTYRVSRILFVVCDNGIKTTEYILKGKYNYYQKTYKMRHYSDYLFMNKLSQKQKYFEFWHFKKNLASG